VFFFFLEFKESTVYFLGYLWDIRIVETTLVTLSI